MTDYLALARGQQPQDAAPDDAGNPYAALVREDQQAQQQLARTVVEHALTGSPEAAAERQRLANTSGLPLRVVERNLEEVRRKEQLRALDLMRMAQDSPVLARQLVDPAFTTVAVDDLGTLASLETAVGKAVRYVMGAAPGGGMVGDLRASLYRGAAGFAGAKMAAVDVVEPWARLVAGDDNWFAGMSRYYGEQAQAATGMAERLSPPGGGVLSSGVSSGVQSLGQNLKYLPLAFTGPGGAAAALGGMVMESFGASYGKAADKNLPLWQSLGYASADAMVEYWTEKIPMDALIGGIRQGAPFIKALGKQLALEIPGEQLATVLQDLNEWATLNPGRPFVDYLADRPDAAAQTLIATVIGTGGNVMVAHGAARVIDATLGSNAWRQNITAGFQSMLDEQMALAGQSLLRERSPEQFRAMVQRVVDANEGAPKVVYVDGEVLNQMPAEVLEALPAEVREQIPAAAAAGAAVAIPMADVLTTAPGTPLEAALAEHARMDPFALSPAEVKAAGDQAAALKLQAERVVQQASDQEAWRQSAEAVRSGIEAQIAATGRYRPAVAEGMSHWAGAFYSTMAARTGMTPEQFAAQYPLRILAEASQPAPAGQELDQPFRRTPEFDAWFGASKVVDEAGAPRVMYHGTGADFDTFRGQQAGAIFLTPEPIFAQAYGDTGAKWLQARGQDGAARIMPVFVKAENPFDYENPAHRQQVIEAALAASGTENGAGERVISNPDGTPSLYSAGVLDAGLADPGEGGNWLLIEQPWFQEAVRAAGFDSFYVNEGGFKNLAVYDPAQVKSAIGNRGAFDPSSASILEQPARGTFNPRTLELVLSPTADLSTFFHETGHFYLEVLADVASQANAPQQVADDMAAVLKWFGVESLGAWQAMTLEQQRQYHERWAESIEQYLMEGKAPSAELAPLMRRFRAWLVAAYRSLKAFLAGRPDAAAMPLNDDIRRVMDRLLATDEQIAQAEEVAGMLPDEEATAAALERQQARSMRDLKWTVRARDKVIVGIQKQAEAERRRVRMQVRSEVMSQPVYRVWQFLTGKGDQVDTAPPMVKQGATRELDVTKDSLLVAVAKLGGIARESAMRDLGVAEDQFKVESGVFGATVFRKDGGRNADDMRELLTEHGYLRQFDEFGRTELRELEDLIAEEIGGAPQYSMSFDYSNFLGDGPRETLPVYAAFGKLDTDVLRGWFGTADDALWRRLSERRMTSDKAGVHPDVVADAFEFTDGRVMAEALAAARPPREVIEELTEQRMLEEHGELVDERAIQEAANEAVHNEARARALATELRAQADLLGQREDTGQTNAGGARITVNAMAEAARQFGAGIAARTVLKDLRDRIWQHTAAERRAAGRWQTATAAGQTQEAVKAKQDQVLNNAAARALVEAKDEAARILEFFRRVTKGGNEKTVERGRDADIVNAARAVLAAYGVDTGTTRAAGDYLAKLKTNDPETWNVVAPMVDDATQAAQPLQALTIEQLQGLHEQVQAMWHLARRSRQLEVDGNLMDIEDAAAELSARMAEIGVPAEAPGERSAVTREQERVRWLQFAGSLLRRTEQWAEAMDGKYGGPFLRYVFQPVKDAADRYRADRIAFRRKFQGLVDAVAPHMQQRLIEAPELGYTFGRGHNGIGMAELLHAILHTGNESNKRKLLLGRKWATAADPTQADGEIDTRRWDEFIDRLIREGVLRREHFDFAQGVWDLLEETKPLAQAAHRDVFGTYFDEITASPVTNALGTWRGGYVPAQADPLIVDDASLRALAEAENESMAYSFPATNRGFTKGRVEYNRPLKLDLRTIPQHLDKVLLFSHMEAPVRGVTRLLRKSDVSKPLGRIDPSIYSGMLLPWLNRSARQQVETPVVGDGRITRVLSTMRSRAGAALMFANVSNTIQQITGLSSAMVKVKPALLMQAAGQYLTSPRKVSREVAAASEYMADRMKNEVSAMNDEVDRILLDPSLYERAQAWSMQHAYFMQTAVDNVLSPIVWTGAYNQALQQGMSERDAVRFADGTVRQTQGSTLPEDVSRIETGRPEARVFTQFIGYFNMMANTNATALQQIARETGLRKGAGKAMLLLTVGMLIPLWVAEAIAIAFRGGPEDEDKDGEYLDDWLAAVLGMGTIKGILASVPFIGQLANAGINRTNNNPADDRVSMSPAISLWEAGVGAPSSVYKAIVDDGNKQKAVRDVASLLSMLTGLPFTAAARPIGYAAGVADDRIEPTSAADAVRGAVTGVASQDSRAP
jgi:hypothetical protein